MGMRQGWAAACLSQLNAQMLQGLHGARLASVEIPQYMEKSRRCMMAYITLVADVPNEKQWGVGAAGGLPCENCLKM